MDFENLKINVEGEAVRATEKVAFEESSNFQDFDNNLKGLDLEIFEIDEKILKNISKIDNIKKYITNNYTSNTDSTDGIDDIEFTDSKADIDNYINNNIDYISAIIDDRNVKKELSPEENKKLSSSLISLRDALKKENIELEKNKEDIHKKKLMLSLSN
jgi:hypothetical protein